MADLSKEEKKAFLKEWKAKQNKKYLLSRTKVRKLFAFLEQQLEREPCDHTLRHTQGWLNHNIPLEKHRAILDEMEEMGGYCDCEVVLNCYENYELN